MLKIAFILPNLNAGGAERVAVNYLRQFDVEQYDINLIVFDKSKDLLALIPQGVNIIDLKTNSTKKSFLVLIKQLRLIKPGIIYTTHSRISTLLMFIKPFVPKFKHIARMQSMPSLENRYNQYGRLKSFLYANGFKSAEIVVAQTTQMKESAVEKFGLKQENIRVMHNPLDKKYIKNAVLGKVSPFSENEISAVASGRLRYEKGFDILFHAITIVIKKYPQFHLYLLGNDNGDYYKLNDLRSELSLDKNITFKGFQENPYIYYATCDVFILSSRWEGFPNAMLENYYLNTPIVATRCVPIVNELIKDGYNGYTCDLENDQCLSRKIIDCIEKIDRKNIKNPNYVGSELEELF